MKPIWKWILGILAVILVALAGVAWYLSHNWKPIVEKKLMDIVKSSTDSLYTLTFDDLDLNVALGNMSLENAVLQPDTIVYRKMEEAQLAPDNIYTIRLKSLKIRRFGILDILSNKKLSIRTVGFDSPDIHLVNTYHAYNDTIAKPSKEGKTLYESLKDVLSSVNVQDINVDNVSFRYTKIVEGKSSEIAVENIKVKVRDVLIDETALQDSSRIFYTKLIDIDVPGFSYEFPDGFYVLKFDGLKINTEEQNILLTNVDFRPKMNRSAYFKQRGENKTMSTLHFDTLRMEHLNFQKLIDKQQILAKKLQIKNGYVKLFGDKRYPKRPTNQIGQAPHQKLLRMKSLMNLDSVFVENVDVEYGEMSPKYHRDGYITFNGATGVLTNVTNDSVALGSDKYMKADLRAKIMNSGNLHAKFSFDMLSKNGAYTYSGTVGTMKAPAFNKILTPLLNVGIGSGNIKSVKFNMSGTDYHTTGDFRFDYNELKLELLNEKKAGEEQKSKKLVSFLVNQLIINDSNPDANEVYHVGKVNYRRVPEHTFFKNLWQSLLEGIKQTAGISPEREARLIGSAQSAQKTVEGAKKGAEKTKGFVRGLFKKKDKEDKK